MRASRHAILAVWAGIGVFAALGPLKDPLPVRFRLADGVRVTGTMTAFDAEGFDGSFGRREWVELTADDVWRLQRRVMDDASALAWVNLGRVLLMIDEGDRWAERAFRQALRHDASIEDEISEARAEAAQRIRLRRQAERVIAAERLKTGSPESEAWRADAWPPLSPQEQDAAVLTMKADARAILQRAGMELEPVETKYFLFYSDMPRAEIAKWARQLDHMYRRLAVIFDLHEQTNIFWGKAVIFVFGEQDRFRLVEAEAFGHLTPLSVSGLCHYRGPKTFVSFYRQPDDLQFAATLVHETVHGFMHRYRTPRRLPTWANEGFAEYLAAVVFTGSPVDQNHRRQAVDYVRRGGDVQSILELTYADGSWPGPEAIGYGVGYLMVGLMIQDRPNRFGDWVKAIKAGKAWTTALEEDFGVPRDRLIETFIRFYQVND